MKENKLENFQNEVVPSFSETKVENTIKFTCSLKGQEIGVISATLIEENTYNIGGLFVDPSLRGQGISSILVKNVNTFLDKNHSLGKLVNTISGNAAKVYENNGWVKGEFKSQGSYGAYEYTYGEKVK